MRQLKITKSITNRESVAIEKYLQEIAREDLLTPEEEVELAKRIKSGDQKALEKLTKANLRFVVSVAKQYQNQGLSLPDLINEGNLGLIKAAQRFDETRGFKFISYAVWWIRQSILQALAEQSRLVRLPLNKVGSLSRIHKAFVALEQEYEREPTPQELAEVLGIPSDEIQKTLSVGSRHLSMDAPIGDEDSSTLLDLLPSNGSDTVENKLEHDESLRQEIENSLACLTPRQREIIKLFYGIGMDEGLSLDDIGARMGLTRERVRQLRDKAIRKLRSNYRCRRLKDYLGN